MKNGNEKFIPNSFQVPNVYIDEYLHVLSNSELKVLVYAIRRIFGFQKRTDRISLSQFCDGIEDSEGNRLDYGTGLSKATVISSLNKLIEYGLIIRLADNNKKNEGCLYQLSAMPDVDDEAIERDLAEKQKVYNERMKKARKGKNEGGLTAIHPSNGYTAPGLTNNTTPVYNIDTHINSRNTEDIQVTPEPEYIEAGSEFEEPKKNGTAHKEMVQALMDATELDMKIRVNAGKIYKASKELREAGYTPEDVNAFKNKWKQDWRYRKDRQPPSISIVHSEIKKAERKQSTEEWLAERRRKSRESLEAEGIDISQYDYIRKD